MRKNNLQPAILSLLLLFSFTAFSQTSITITGNVRHSVTDDRVPAVSVTIKGTSVGTYTDDHGNFRLSTTQQPPLVLVFSVIGRICPWEMGHYAIRGRFRRGLSGAGTYSGAPN